MKFLEEFIFPLFENQLKVPRLKKLYSGELISIVYFEYLNLIKILPPEEEKSLIEVSHLLHKISLENDDFLATLGFFKQLSDFRQHYQYLKNSKLSKDYLETHEINALSFEQAAESSKRILTHSDLHVGNIFQNMVLIDWDHFGFYPIGFDPAFLYFRLLENNQIKETDPSKWIMDNYFRLIEPKDWEDFERNFYYFLWVFSIKRLEKKQIYNSEDLINKLINKLKSYKI